MLDVIIVKTHFSAHLRQDIPIGARRIARLLSERIRRMKTHPEKNRPMTSRRDPVITVCQGEGDIQGKDDKILQAGIEYLHRLGGCVLHILPGEYTMRNALHMRPGVHIRGSGPATTLKKAPSVVASLIQDSDWFEARVRVDNPEGFSAGGGVMLRAYYDAGTFRMMVVRDTITAIEGDTLSLSRRLEHNMWPSLQATASTLFPLITAEYVNDITIENLVLDGNREHNEEINGNYAGGVFIQHCDRYTFRNVI